MRKVADLEHAHDVGVAQVDLQQATACQGGRHLLQATHVLHPVLSSSWLELFLLGAHGFVDPDGTLSGVLGVVPKGPDASNAPNALGKRKDPRVE